MILSMVSSFSGLSGKGSSGEFVQRNWPYNQQDDNNFEARIPDGILFSNDFCLLFASFDEPVLNITHDMPRSNCCYSRRTPASVLHG